MKWGKKFQSIQKKPTEGGSGELKGHTGRAGEMKSPNKMVKLNSNTVYLLS